MVMSRHTTALYRHPHGNPGIPRFTPALPRFEIRPGKSRQFNTELNCRELSAVVTGLPRPRYGTPRHSPAFPAPSRTPPPPRYSPVSPQFLPGLCRDPNPGRWDWGLSKPLTISFNNSIKTGKLPTDLASIVAKCMTKIIRENIVKYFKNNNLFANNNFDSKKVDRRQYNY